MMFRAEVFCNMQDWREQRQPATQLDCLREGILKQKGLVIGYYKEFSEVVKTAIP